MITPATTEKNTGQNSSATPNTQVACIDLPGESVKCWRSYAHLQVVLRKHRDVLFNIKLFKGMVYTVHAEHGDFYNADTKKLVLKGQSAQFKDGQQAHFWVGREFLGALTLKANGKVMGRYYPNLLDMTAYSPFPGVKPAPLIIAINNDKSDPAPNPLLALASRPPAEDDDGTQSMHVIEVKPDDPKTPQPILDLFKRGGEETALDTNGQLTRNWLLGSIMGTATYLWDNKHWIKELWKQKFYMKSVVHPRAGKKWYIIFKGNPRLREFFTAAKYGVRNAKVLAITSGAGSAAGLRHGTWDAIKGGVKRGGAVAIIFTIALDTMEWMNDYEQIDPKTGKRKKDFFDLAFKIGVSLAKAGISAAAGAAIMGALVFAGVVTGGAVLVVGAIVLAIGIGLLIDYVDKKTGAMDKLNQMIRNGAKYLESKLPADYGKYDNSLEQALMYGGMGA